MNLYNINVQFREANRSFSLLDPIRVIARDFGFNVVDIATVIESQIIKIKTNRPSIPPRLFSRIKRIEELSFRRIEVGRLGSGFRPVLNFNGDLILNYDHKSFQNLILGIDYIVNGIIDFYLLGMLSNDIILTFTEPPSTPTESNSENQIN